MERTLLIEAAALGSEDPVELVNWRPDRDFLGGAHG
jgi:hypothetical protein